MDFIQHTHKPIESFICCVCRSWFLKNINNDEQQIFNEKFSTFAYQERRMYSVGYYLKCEFDDNCRTTQPAETKWIALIGLSQRLKKSQKSLWIFIKNRANKIDSVDEKRTHYDPATVFHVRELPFGINEQRIFDHCHFSGRYRGPTHNECNLLFYYNLRIIPVIMLNLTGYDGHLFINKLATGVKVNIDIIPNNTEQYLSFTKTVEDITQIFHKKIKFRFIDSFWFMPSSLAELVALLPMGKKCILYTEFGKYYSNDLIKISTGSVSDDCQPASEKVRK